MENKKRIARMAVKGWALRELVTSDRHIDALLYQEVSHDEESDITRIDIKVVLKHLETWQAGSMSLEVNHNGSPGSRVSVIGDSWDEWELETTKRGEVLGWLMKYKGEFYHV